MILSNLSLPDLLHQIDLYFDCQLSDTQEAELRRIIAHTQHAHPAIDEARAIMGLRKVQTHVPARAFTSRSWIAAAAAAVVICVVAINLVFFSDSHDTADYECFAYVNGRRVTDEDEVMKMLAADLKEFSQAAEDIDNDFSSEISDMASIIEGYEYPIP